MPLGEKKRLILALDAQNGKELFRENWILYCKERIALLLNRMGLR